MSLETLDVGQANELKLAFRRNGWTNEEVKKLCEGSILGELRKVMLGLAEVKPLDHLIDLDLAPFVPDGWQVEEHKKGGKLKWDPSRIQLHLSENQKGDNYVEGNKLRRELYTPPTLNANVLDYLLKHKELIPEEWKRDEKGNTRYIFFWGTIYRNSNGNLYVRYLCWYDGEWGWVYNWLAGDWDRDYPAVVSAS